jgi:hypothetical protein
MTPPRFTPDQVQSILRLDPGATYHPPSRPDAADDFLKLSDGSALPNPTRAGEWIHAQPEASAGRAWRPHLTVVPGGRAGRAGPRRPEYTDLVRAATTPPDPAPEPVD